MQSVGKLLARPRQNVFKELQSIFFAFCDVILVLSNIFLDISMQWMNYGYNVEKYVEKYEEKLNFPWKKTVSQFSYNLQFYNRNN